MHKIHQISVKKLAEFTHQLATLCQAKIDLSQALFILIQEENNLNMKSMMMTIKNNIENGMSFSESLSAFPKYFDTIYCGLVAAGEKSGALENILLQLSSYQDRRLELRAKIAQSLFYPSIVLASAIFMTIGLLIFVVPQFTHIFNSFGAKLPLFTQCVIHISQILQHDSLQLLVVVITGVLVYRYILRRWTWFRMQQAIFLWRLPMIGPLLMTALLAGWTRLLATLLKADLSLMESLQIAGQTITHPSLRMVMGDMMDRIGGGSTFSEALAVHERWFRAIVQMVTVGENAGQLAMMLEKIADIQQKALDQRVNYLSKWLEPAVMLILAGITGSLIIAIYLPVFRLGGVI
jgi:type IV pilus assembly protein PilC